MSKNTEDAMKKINLATHGFLLTFTVYKMQLYLTRLIPLRTNGLYAYSLRKDVMNIYYIILFLLRFFFGTPCTTMMQYSEG